MKDAIIIKTNKNTIMCPDCDENISIKEYIYASCGECGCAVKIEPIEKEAEPKDIAVLIKSYIPDIVTDFLYYDRKEDEDLPRGVIEKCVADGEITIDEIVEGFKKALTEGLKE